MSKSRFKPLYLPISKTSSGINEIVISGDMLDMLNDIINILGVSYNALSNRVEVDKTGSVRTNILSMPATPWSGSPNVTLSGTSGVLATVSTVTNLSQMDGAVLKPTLLHDTAGTAWGTCIRSLM